MDKTRRSRKALCIENPKQLQTILLRFFGFYFLHLSACSRAIFGSQPPTWSRPHCPCQIPGHQVTNLTRSHITLHLARQVRPHSMDRIYPETFYNVLHHGACLGMMLSALVSSLLVVAWTHEPWLLKLLTAKWLDSLNRRERLNRGRAVRKCE